MDKPIRILNLFTIMDRGGAETLVMNYYRHIDRSKVQFDFMVHRQERGAYDDEIEALGGRIYRMSPIYPQNFGRYKRELEAFFSAHPEYRIVHSHMSELGYFAFLEAERQGVPVRICHAHNAPHGFDAKLIVRTYFKKRMMPHITDMFMCGKASGDWLFGKKNADQFIMMNNAIDSSAFAYSPETRARMRQELGIEGKLVIGHVGRFHPQKNHRFLIEVFREIQKNEKNSVLLLVGTGDCLEEIKQQVKQYGLWNHVRFLGVRSDVNELMQAMDVFLFPSLYEGLPVTLVEAQAAGLPCVISDCIPPECKVTDLISPYPLSMPAQEWANAVLEKAHILRRDMRQEIISAGFDIGENAKWLEAYYLDKWKENE